MPLRVCRLLKKFLVSSLVINGDCFCGINKPFFVLACAVAYFSVRQNRPGCDAPAETMFRPNSSNNSTSLQAMEIYKKEPSLTCIMVKFLGKDQLIGAAIVIVSLAVALFYFLSLFFPAWLNIFGVGSASVQFWVIAIPVFIGFTGILVIGAWIGWTMATTPPPKPIEEATT